MEEYKSLRQGNLVDVVFSTIKQDIIRGKLDPGDRFPPQEKLAKQFGVSRTVIREAQKNWLPWVWWKTVKGAVHMYLNHE